MGEPEGRLPSDSISSRSEERCGEVGPVGGRVGVREEGREEGNGEKKRLRTVILYHTPRV